MNSDIIVINAYPNTIEKEVILENCVKQLKKTDKDILLITHYPVKRETQQLVDYFIYDIRNPLLTGGSALYWYGNKDFYFQTNFFELGRHSFAVLLSIQNAISFAKNLNKKMFYYFEGDCLISDKDLKQIDILKNEVYKKNKRGYIPIYTIGGDVLNKGVCTLFFMLDIDFYYENFGMLQTCEEYKDKVNNGILLEFYFYQGLEKNIDQLIVIEGTVKNFLEEIFPNSNFNLLSYQSEHFIDILPEQKSKKTVLVITNGKKDKIEYKISFFKNDNTISKGEVSILSGGYYYNILAEEVKRIHIFYKENDKWELVYDKDPRIEVKKKSEVEYVRIG